MATLQEAEALLGSEYLTGLYDTFLAQTGNAELAAQSVQAAISGFASETGSGGAPQPSGQAQMGVTRSQSDILADLQAKRITRDQAIQEFLGLGVPYSQAVLSVDNVLGGVGGAAAGAGKAGAGAGGTSGTAPGAANTFEDFMKQYTGGFGEEGGKIGPPEAPFGFETPDMLRRAALDELTRNPRQAFSQLFDVAATRPGGLVSDALFNFTNAPAQSGFRLSPFLRPELSADELGKQQLGDFLRGGLPSLEDIAGGVRNAAMEPTGFTNPFAQARARFLQRPEQNPLAFATAFQPFLAQGAGQFQDDFSQFLSQQFNRFQQERPGASFLKALGAGALPGFRGFGGF